MDWTRADAASANEAIADEVVKRQVYGERVAAGTYRKVLKNLVALEGDLRAQIARADVNGVRQTAAKRKRLEALLEETRREIRKTYRKINRIAAADMSDIIPIEARATQQILNRTASTLSIELGAGLPTQAVLTALTDQLIVAGLPMLSWWEKQAVATIDAVQQQLTIGVQAGETIEQMTRRIVGTEVNGPDGVMALSKRNARTLVRTSVASVQNTARQASYEANADIFTALIHLSRLDSRTSKICIARSGKKWEVVSKEPIDHNLPFQVPPLHPSCYLGHTLVKAVGELQGGSQRYVTCDILTIETVAGRKISVTPNHPILTLNGWLKAKDLQIADQLMCMTDGGLPISDLARSVIASTNSEFYSIRTDARHYHGDGADSKTCDLGLYNHVKPGPMIKLEMGSFDDAEECLRQLIMRTGAVSLDRVASITSEPYEGWVYNIETSTGLYTAEGIVTHNCRSVLIPQVIGGSPPPDMDADVWLKKLPKSELESLLGKSAAKLYLDGKINSSELIDQSNRPLTVTQLAEL